MAKTLKISTILAAALALGLIIFIASKGVASDKEIDKFLSLPGVAEQMQNGSGIKGVTEQETPLIRQAKLFALRINPPPPPMPVATTPAAVQEVIQPKVEVSAKFKLVGTSYHTGDEANSCALIDEVGKGWHWVNQGEMVGYLKIEKVGDGVVLVRDNDRTFELAAERELKPDFVTSFSGSKADERIIPEWQGKSNSVKEAASETKTSVNNTENAQPEQPMEDPNVTKKQLEDNIKWLKQLQDNPETVGMSKEEANELGNLGEFLKSVESSIQTESKTEPNQNASTAIKSSSRDSNEPRQIKRDSNEPLAPATVKAKQLPKRDPNSPRISRPATEPNQAGHSVGPRGLRRIRKTR